MLRDGREEKKLPNLFQLGDHDEPQPKQKCDQARRTVCRGSCKDLRGLFIQSHSDMLIQARRGSSEHELLQGSEAEIAFPQTSF